jgi:uncharacterized membrane protein YidH (DUF202 family)
MDSATTRKILGIVLVIVGIGLAYWGYQMSGSVSSQLNEALTGSPTDRVMIYYIAALASAAVGVFLLVKK